MEFLQGFIDFIKSIVAFIQDLVQYYRDQNDGKDAEFPSFD